MGKSYYFHCQTKSAACHHNDNMNRFSLSTAQLCIKSFPCILSRSSSPHGRGISGLSIPWCKAFSSSKHSGGGDDVRIAEAIRKAAAKKTDSEPDNDRSFQSSPSSDTRSNVQSNNAVKTLIPWAESVKQLMGEPIQKPAGKLVDDHTEERMFIPEVSLHAADGRSRKRILILCTGGTLTMAPRPEDGALAPVQGALSHYMDSMSELSNENMPEYVLHEYSPFVDSSDMGPADWAVIAGDIQANYLHFVRQRRMPLFTSSIIWLNVRIVIFFFPGWFRCH